MRFLKKKLALANQTLQENSSFKQKRTFASDESDDETILNHRRFKKNSLHGCADLIEIDYEGDQEPLDIKSVTITSLPYSNKRILADFGEAISSFVSSDLALPYLSPFLYDNMSLGGFRDFVESKNYVLTTTGRFYSLLRVEDDDEEEVVIYKKIFRNLAEIFIKYFSVNWIINSKLNNKLVYLKNRLKVLRRIRNPQNLASFRKL